MMIVLSYDRNSEESLWRQRQFLQPNLTGPDREADLCLEVLIQGLVELLSGLVNGKFCYVSYGKAYFGSIAC
jgi:hypothetical protein